MARKRHGGAWRGGAHRMARQLAMALHLRKLALNEEEEISKPEMTSGISVKKYLYSTENNVEENGWYNI